MKNIFFFSLVSMPFLTQAQLETYGRYTAGGYIEPNINYFGSKKITNKISLTFFGLVEQKWSQALVGVTYSPSNSFSVGAGTGIEQGTNSPRFSASIWRGKGRTSFLFWGERGSGKDNYMYKTNLFYKSSDRFTFGLTAWRNHGVGPNFRFAIPKLSLTIWTMPAYDFEANKSRLMVGVSTSLI